jgi:YVTN family beta-propeller protein
MRWKKLGNCARSQWIEASHRKRRINSEGFRESNDVSVLDLKSRKELRRIKVGDGPWGIVIVSVSK